MPIHRAARAQATCGACSQLATLGTFRPAFSRNTSLVLQLAFASHVSVGRSPGRPGLLGRARSCTHKLQAVSGSAGSALPRRCPPPLARTAVKRHCTTALVTYMLWPTVGRCQGGRPSLLPSPAGSCCTVLRTAEISMSGIIDRVLEQHWQEQQSNLHAGALTRSSAELGLSASEPLLLESGELRMPSMPAAVPSTKPAKRPRNVTAGALTWEIWVSLGFHDVQPHHCPWPCRQLCTNPSAHVHGRLTIHILLPNWLDMHRPAISC